MIRQRAAAASVILATLGEAGGTGEAKRPSVNQMVELTEGRRIAIQCEGVGRFTVLLETGDGEPRRGAGADLPANDAPGEIRDASHCSLGDR